MQGHRQDFEKGGQVVWCTKRAAKFFETMPLWAWSHLFPRYNSGINHKSIIIDTNITCIYCSSMQAQPQIKPQTHN